jgi:hypothetical protein
LLLPALRFLAALLLPPTSSPTWLPSAPPARPPATVPSGPKAEPTAAPAAPPPTVPTASPMLSYTCKGNIITLHMEGCEILHLNYRVL